ncbi:S66 peptidase family protein [Aeromicrobium chenweiae]|uniref:S66 peptidase family protein n=1 Tax=Aeromicrobium chenweiae TaxID=2079793 RepID=UPI0018FFEBCB|nr:LD-carboxypeptidase [Aeromicrobium chenweiae]
MRVRRGDRVALVAPAGPAPADQLAAAVELVRSWDLVPDVRPSATAVHPRASYLSGSDAVRAADVQEAWCDPDVAAIFCIRGGYGTVRILDLLDPEAMAAAPAKPLFGSSDITALHEWLRERLGAPSWFTPMISTSAVLADDLARAGLRTAVLDPGAVRRWTSDSAVALVPGRAEGVLIGGNLSLLAATVGARGRPAPDHHGCIALLEDYTEQTYRIDGYLQTLLRAGWFEGVTGIALGSWAACSPVEEIHALCAEVLGPLGVPLVGELGFGHGPAAHSIPLGVGGTLVAEGAAPHLTWSGRLDR